MRVPPIHAEEHTIVADSRREQTALTWSDLDRRADGTGESAGPAIQVGEITGGPPATKGALQS
ncbi:hypothetical protein ACN27G_18905 [Plantactinospora sp. WMMB334]|uniref:hypothetical protein n=1 Tax=Plantactinospora sp. WMMB334 TaxID=3404119 RepID=UPI003B9347B8